MNRTHDDIQDELLVLQCQEGNGEALKALFARWQPRLGRFARRLTSDREAALDVTQESWMAIVRGIGRLDDPARFRSWVYRIVCNKSTDWIRRRAVQRNAANDLREAAVSERNDTSNETDSADETARLRVALAKLPDESRAILSLHYLDGMGIAEIARVLSVPVGTVKSRLYHARNRLRQVLERVET